MSNLIPIDIRNLFPPKEVLPEPSELVQKVQIDQYLEKTEEIYNLNIVSSKRALENVYDILMLKDSNLKAIAMAALGGIHTFNGNYSKAFAAFSAALDQVVSGDIKAYIFAELSNLWRTLGYVGEAISILEAGLDMTKNEKLKWRIKTYIGLCQKYTNPQYALSVLQRSGDHYRKARDYVRLGSVSRHIGLVHVYLKNFREAKEYLDETMRLAVEHCLIDHEYAVMNDKGWMLIQQGKYDKAKNLLVRLIQKELSPYLMSRALQNIGYLEYERRNYQEAVQFHSQSLQLTTRHELRGMAFEDYFKLGLCHEKLGEIGLADHFYSTGYLEAMKEMNIGLPILGYRKKLINAYVEFLRKNQRIPQIDVKAKIFAFATDKTIKEIRNIFHTAYFNLHLQRTKNAPQLCKKLQIKTRTYFIYQKKLNLKRGEPKPIPVNDNPYFGQYLESLAPLTWKEANKQFESDLYAFLLEHYQHSKIKLAEVLGVSYQQVVIKTKK